MQHRDPAAVEAVAFAALDALAGDGPLALGVSGGGDSMALLHLAARWGRAGDGAAGGMVIAASVDHGFRGAAAGECAAAARQAARLGVAHTTLAVRPGAGNLQAAARRARLEALGAWAVAAGAGALALAHTEDDQAETVLMRLARGGAGAGGLAAMRPSRDLRLADRPDAPAITLVRPLLGLSRKALRLWLRAKGVGWIEEPSNLDPRFDRVRARAALAHLAPLGLTPERLAATATRAAAEVAVLEDAAEALAARALTLGPAGDIRLDGATLVSAPVETALRVIALAACALTGAAYPPRREALERARAFAARAHTAPGDEALGDGVLLSARVPGALTLMREPAATEPRVAADDGACWDDRLLLRSSAPGLWLGAVGDTMPLLPAADGAVWRRAPLAARRSAPALYDAQGALIAVRNGPGGWLRAENAPLGAAPDPALPGATDLVLWRLRQPPRGA